MTTALITVDLAAAHAQESIRTGQQAWKAIKATAEEQRTLWLEVGVALMYGKIKENRKAGQKFSEWVQEMFPGLSDKTASDAIWWATNSGVTPEIPEGLSHPENIRKWFNEQAATQTLPTELQETPAPEPTVVLPKATAVKVNKLVHRSTTDDEGSETAARHLKAFARQHGVDLDALVKAAAEGDPDGHHRFDPPIQQSIDTWRTNMQAGVAAMERTGLSREAIKHLLINLANSL